MLDDASFEPSTWDGVDLETLIRDAGSYVHPGDQLRGRILDAVATRRVRRASWRRYFSAVSLSTSMALLLILLGHLTLSVAPRGRSASDLHDQATRRSLVEGVAWEWALTDVVYDWRRSETVKGFSQKPTRRVEGER